MENVLNRKISSVNMNTIEMLSIASVRQVMSGIEIDNNAVRFECCL